MTVELDRILDDSVIDSWKDYLKGDRPLTKTEESTNRVAQEVLNTAFAASSASSIPGPAEAPLEHIDPARVGMEVALAFEQRSVVALKNLEDESNKIIETIDLLLELSKELAVLDIEKPVLTEKMKGQIEEIKKRGIDLLSENGNGVSKEQIGVLKSSIGSHIDKLRTKIQQLFTKMQTVVQNMTSVNDSIKRILSEHSDLLRKINENARRH